MRKAATKRAGETFEIRKIDIEFLSQYLVEIVGNTPSGWSHACKGSEGSVGTNLGAHKRHDRFRRFVPHYGA
jgi:hypothetical protein